MATTTFIIMAAVSLVLPGVTALEADASPAEPTSDDPLCKVVIDLPGVAVDVWEGKVTVYDIGGNAHTDCV